MSKIMGLIYKANIDDCPSGPDCSCATLLLKCGCCKISVCFPCNTMLPLSWLEEETDWFKSLSFLCALVPQLISYWQSTAESAGPPSSCHKRKDCSYCQSVLSMYSAPAGRADNRQAWGKSVALRCLRLVYTGNALPLRLPHTLWCDCTVVTLIQAHFDLALSRCSFWLPPTITLPSLPGVQTLQLLTLTTPRLIL